MNGTKKENVTAYKVVLLGDVFVGKTFLANRFVKDSVPISPLPTVGVEFSTKKEVLRDGSLVKAQIWDTAGQERYRSVTSAKAAGALLVFDLTNQKSFQSIERWVEELRTHAGDNVRMFLLGNKLDEVTRDERKRAVRYSDAAAYAERNGMTYVEVSAVSGENVRESFLSLLESIHTGDSPNSIGGIDVSKPQTPKCTICSC